LTKVAELGSASSGTMSGMENIQAQIQSLQASVRRQRFANIALATLLAGSVLLGAVSPAGDATFDTITCKEWRVVDNDGKARIVANTDAGDIASVSLKDKDGNARFKAFIFAQGYAGVSLKDKNGKQRIGVGTGVDGDAGVTLSDIDGKPRIVASTTGIVRSNASVAWYDKDGKARIEAAIRPTGAVTLPTNDLGEAIELRPR